MCTICSTAVCRIDAAAATNVNTVKAVVSDNGKVLYCSRLPIPWGGYSEGIENFFYQHIGVYGYRRDILSKYSRLGDTKLQKSEDLEQLKILENGYTIHAVEVRHHAPGVDTMDDLEKVCQIMTTRNSR